MPLHPDRLINQFSERILVSLDSTHLKNLLVDGILPSLLVRQSLLLRLPPGGGTEVFMALRVAPDQTPDAEAAARLARPSSRLLNAPGTPGLLAWARLAIPLRMGNQVTGLWLFGARDPDDHYNTDDIETLETLAAQIALALAHIDQANSLRALYLADVNQRDAERMDFARELHDAVLNPLAVLSNSPFMTQVPVPMDTLLEEMIQHVRRVVKGLRPEMLNHGLRLGLQTLVDDLSDTITGGKPIITLSVPDSFERLDPKGELNIFRIVQQACQNAIRHAGAGVIIISGEIEEDRVSLSVEDDGRGFDFGGQMNLAGLLAHQHYGLAGMFERAGMIGADIRISSTIGKGTCVQVEWNQKLR